MYGDNFLIHDTGKGSRNRIIMFAREIQLRTLTSAKTWLMDGTVLMAPGIFSQLYVIRIPLGKSAVTAIYAFLPNKAQRTYKEMFQVITDACIRQVLMLIQKKSCL